MTKDNYNYLIFIVIEEKILKTW